MKCTSHGGLQQLHLRSDGRNSRPTFAAGSLGKVGADRYGSVRRSRRYRKSRQLIRLSHIVQRIPLKFNDLPISLTITSSQNAVKTVKRRKPRRRIALWWGTFVLWNGENLDFMRFSGIEKVHRNSIKITVDLWLRNRDSNPNKQSQSLPCYRYTIPQCLRTYDIISDTFLFVNPFL